MTSDVDICNMALGRLGQTSNIADLDEDSNEAFHCKRYYAQARDGTLRAHDWAFARRRVGLASLGVGPAGWGYRYAYPADAVNIAAVLSSDAPWPCPRYGRPPAFEVGGSTGAEGNEVREIYTGLSPAQCVYTRRVTDASIYDPLFVTAFSWQLAFETAMGITGDESRMMKMGQGFNTALAQARVANANERGQRPDERASEWTRARNGGCDSWG